MARRDECTVLALPGASGTAGCKMSEWLRHAWSVKERYARDVLNRLLYAGSGFAGNSLLLCIYMLRSQNDL